MQLISTDGVLLKRKKLLFNKLTTIAWSPTHSLHCYLIVYNFRQPKIRCKDKSHQRKTVLHFLKWLLQKQTLLRHSWASLSSWWGVLGGCQVFAQVSIIFWPPDTALDHSLVKVCEGNLMTCGEQFIFYRKEKKVHKNKKIAKIKLTIKNVCIAM